MALVSGYDNEIFISYSHIDNEPFGDPRGGWVDIFHEHLQNFVNVHVGRRTKVWRDKRLTGAEVFSDEIEQQLRSSAILVSVFRRDTCNPNGAIANWSASPRPPRTGAIFGSATCSGSSRCFACRWNGVRCRPCSTKCWAAVLSRGSASGRARDLLLDPSADARAGVPRAGRRCGPGPFAIAGAMAESGGATAIAVGVRRRSRPPRSPAPCSWPGPRATSPRNARSCAASWKRAAIKVVPAGAPPLDAAGVRERIVAALKDAKVAIHLIGAHYGFVPEGEERSIIELQSDEAIYQASTSTAARIFWLAPNAQRGPTTERLDRAGAAAVVPRAVASTCSPIKPSRLSRPWCWIA